MNIEWFEELKARYGLTMRASEVAEICGCSASHVREMTRDGRLHGIRFGSRWVFPTTEIAALLEGKSDNVLVDPPYKETPHAKN